MKSKSENAFNPKSVDRPRLRPIDSPEMARVLEPPGAQITGRSLLRVILGFGVLSSISRCVSKGIVGHRTIAFGCIDKTIAVSLNIHRLKNQAFGARLRVVFN